MFYFIYGIVSTIYVLTAIFSYTYDEYLDEYYIRLLMNHSDEFNYFNIIISAIFGIFSLIWVYTQGLSAAKEISTIQEKEENISNNKDNQYE